MAASRVALGRVVGAHGIRGELRIQLPDGDDSNLKSVPSVWLGRAEGDPKAVEVPVVAVGSGRKGEARLALAGVESRDAAEALRGHWVMARPEHLARLAPGEYYQYELVGCRVEDLSGRSVGIVRGVWETGAPDVLVVEGEGGVEHLIPCVPEILREVDREERRIAIDAPPGLLAEPATEAIPSEKP